MPVALIYRRVSTEEQAESGYSLADQYRECKQRADLLGATEIIDIVDDMGGDYLERTQLQRALSICRSGTVRWFICWDPDRFSRKLKNQMLATDVIEEAHVELVFVNHNRTKDAEGNLFFQIRGAVAEYEKAKILERTARGKAAKLEAGKMPGWFDPYGYVLNTETDELQRCESQAAVVSQIYAWATDPDPKQRLSPTKIAHRLNEARVGAPRGNYWYRSTVGDILRNPLYTGVLTWGRYRHAGVYQARRAQASTRPKPVPVPEEKWKRIAVPVIIKRDLWQLAQHYLDLDKNRRTPGRMYMLTGMVVCARCGASVGLKRTTVRWFCCNRRYPHQQMSRETRATWEKCTLPHIRADAVEGFVWRSVCSWLQDHADLERVATTGPAESVAARSPVRAELDMIEAKLRENEAAQVRLLQHIMKAKVREDLAQRAQADLNEQADSLRKHQALLQQQLETAENTAAVRQTFLCSTELRAHLVHHLDLLTEERRHELVRRLVSRVVLSGKTESDWEVQPVSL